MIARSKEILTVNLAIQVVKDEIKILQDKARDMEEVLNRRRLEMEQEAEALDSRLNESDDVAAAALKEAEKTAKLRLQKTQDLQNSNGSFRLLKSVFDELPEDGTVADAGELATQRRVLI